MPKKFENKFVFIEGGDIKDEIYNFINFIKELDLCIDKEEYQIHKYIRKNINNKPIYDNVTEEKRCSPTVRIYRSHRCR